LRDFVDNFRYDHPGVFRTVLAVLICTVLVFGFISLPQSPLMRAVGITAAQKKVMALYYAIFWQLRAETGQPDPDARFEVKYGSMAGLDSSGKLIVSVPSGDRFVQSTVNLADVKLTDLYGTASLIGHFRTEDAKFEIYGGNQAVVWIRNVPFNVKVIEAGFAIPDPNPPTNIVDAAFATYYWRMFNGTEKE
jgi:hypothetical protein